MSREIKYRFWDIKGKKFNFPENLAAIGAYFILTAFNKTHEAQEFTGLKDKNNKDIYEGDIIKWRSVTNTYDFVEQVIFRQGTFGFASDGGLPFQILNPKKVEVIGNIHENKNLLK